MRMGARSTNAIRPSWTTIAAVMATQSPEDGVRQTSPRCGAHDTQPVGDLVSCLPHRETVKPMTRFSADTRAGAVVAAPQADIWNALTDPALVARLTPFVRSIREEGDHWHWQMTGLTVLGVGIAPAFTERMAYDEPRRIEFRHDPPPGATERSAVEGWYELEEVEGGTRLGTSLEITLDLPLPKVSGRAVRAAMNGVIEQMGERFSRNLLAHLGAQEIR
jgi:carbon monoxide dehydrogenase subunit G